MQKPIASVVVAAILALATAGAGGQGAAQDPPDPVERLERGNQRFVNDAGAAPPLDAQTRPAADGRQSPAAVVLSCADARVPPETVFNAGLGQIFVVRTAGGVVDRAVLASVEYAIGQLHVPLLVVMGHESCDMVRAAIETGPSAQPLGPNLDYVMKEIRPAFDRLTTPADVEHLREAVLAVVEESVNDLLDRSDVVRGAVEGGQLKVVGAYYELTTGRVRFSAPVHLSADVTAGAR